MFGPPINLLLEAFLESTEPQALGCLARVLPCCQDVPCAGWL